MYIPLWFLRSRWIRSCLVLSTSSLAGFTVLLFSVGTSVEVITDTSTHICGSMKTFERLNFSTVYSLMVNSHRALKELGMIFTFHVRSAREGNVFSLFVYSQGGTRRSLVPGPFPSRGNSPPKQVCSQGVEVPPKRPVARYPFIKLGGGLTEGCRQQTVLVRGGGVRLFRPCRRTFFYVKGVTVDCPLYMLVNHSFEFCTGTDTLLVGLGEWIWKGRRGHIPRHNFLRFSSVFAKCWPNN